MVIGLCGVVHELTGVAYCAFNPVLGPSDGVIGPCMPSLGAAGGSSKETAGMQILAGRTSAIENV